MREINLNNKIYYIVAWVAITIMLLGALIENPRMGEFSLVLILHILLVISLSACLLVYPKHSTFAMRITIIIVATIYFYILFIGYPDTFSTFIFLCFIPALSILFFDKKLFYFSMIFNIVSIMLLFTYILLIDHGAIFPKIEKDIFGNFANFLASQVIIYFIFYLSNARIKRQQVYYEQIQQSERLKTTGQLAAAVAHEIRNPLTVVKGFLQMFQEDSSFEVDRKRQITLMIDELYMAEQVINQFLTMAKPDQAKVTESVNVKEALQSVTELLQSYGHIHYKTIDLKVKRECNVSANYLEFKQLLINLIKNAIEASETGDTVEVSADSEKDFVTIKVTDHGRGMTEKEVAAQGTPFYSLKSKGTGLGMMICFNIVEKYNGTIDFQSVIGKGTTVTIRFPATC